jgi:hypothetical protein
MVPVVLRTEIGSCREPEYLAANVLQIRLMLIGGYPIAHQPSAPPCTNGSRTVTIRNRIDASSRSGSSAAKQSPRCRAENLADSPGPSRRGDSRLRRSRSIDRDLQFHHPVRYAVGWQPEILFGHPPQLPVWAIADVCFRAKKAAYCRRVEGFVQRHFCRHAS